MQQRFRRPICIRLCVASLGLIAASQALVAQQQPSFSGPSSGTPPQSFRLKTPTASPSRVETPLRPESNPKPVDPNGPATPAPGLSLSEPPPINWPRTQEPASKTSASLTLGDPSDDDDGGVLLIGSASTRLASGSDDEVGVFSDMSTDGSAADDQAADDWAADDRALLVILELANASMSHVSPLFRILTASIPEDAARDPLTERPRKTPARWTSSKDRQLTVREADTSEAIETHASEMDEPPRLVAASDSEMSLTETQLAEADLNASQSDHKSKATATPEAVFPLDSTEHSSSMRSRKPTPRTVKMPFEESPLAIEPSQKPAKSTSSSKNERKEILIPDVDSQKNQEEPAIEPVPRNSDRDLQGIDALKASKPGLHRREIRIDDNGQGRSVPPIVPKKMFEPELEQRLRRAQACTDFYLKNPESTTVRSPWAVMHAVLAYGGEYELMHGAGRVNALGWMCHNGTCRTQRMFTPRGKGFVPNVGDGVQGHEGQFLAILAQCNVPLEYPIQIGASKFKVEDLVRYEMANCKEKSELTFKLIGLSYYLDCNKQWRANDGLVWSIPKLIQEELAQPIVGSACGGTHRLMGFSFSVRQRQLQNQPVNGQYARAAKFVREYVPYTLQLQNPDGSFSTNWYEGRGNEPNEDRKVQTSGHMMEWLMYTMSDEELKQPRIAKGIDFLLSRIYDQRDKKWPIGPRGHATRALALCNARINDMTNIPTSSPVNSTAKSTAPTSKSVAPQMQTATKPMAVPIIRK